VLRKVQHLFVFFGGEGEEAKPALHTATRTSLPAPFFLHPSSLAGCRLRERLELMQQRFDELLAAQRPQRGAAPLPGDGEVQSGSDLEEHSVMASVLSRSHGGHHSYPAQLEEQQQEQRQQQQQQQQHGQQGCRAASAAAAAAAAGAGAVAPG
jgi:hypothetical protein